MSFSQTVSLRVVTLGTKIRIHQNSVMSGERFFQKRWYSSNMLLTVDVNSCFLDWNTRISTGCHLEMDLEK